MQGLSGYNPTTSKGLSIHAFYRRRKIEIERQIERQKERDTQRYRKTERDREAHR